MNIREEEECRRDMQRECMYMKKEDTGIKNTEATTVTDVDTGITDDLKKKQEH